VFRVILRRAARNKECDARGKSTTNLSGSHLTQVIPQYVEVVS
jgi:hypothetical protein